MARTLDDKQAALFCGFSHSYWIKMASDASWPAPHTMLGPHRYYLAGDLEDWMRERAQKKAERRTSRRAR